MNKHVLNRKLFYDMFRQLRLMGILYALVSILGCVLPVIIERINGVYSNGTVPMEAITPVLTVLIYISSITLVYRAFSFLNRRCDSDFYHSLPHSRLSLFTNFTLAVFAWQMIIILSTLLLTWATYGLCQMSVNPIHIYYLLMMYTVVSLVLMGGTLIATAITGTRFNNIIVTILILLLPQGILCLLGYSAINYSVIASNSDLGVLLNLQGNLVIGLIAQLFLQGSPGFSQAGGFPWVSIGYTGAIAILMLAASAFLHINRKSELADRSAPNRLLQHVYRCAIALPFLLVLSYTIVNKNQNGYGLVLTNSIVISMVVLSLLVYFVYELITTRRLRNLITCAPVYLCVVAAAAGVAGGSVLLGNTYANRIPAAQDIESISILNDFFDYGQPSYNQLLMESIDYTSPEIKQLVHDNLAETAKLVKMNQFYMQRSDNQAIVIQIRTANRQTFQRKILFAPEDAKRLGQLVSDNSAYQRAFYQLPQDNEILSLDAYSDYYYTNGTRYAQSLWNQLRQELPALSPGDFALCLNQNYDIHYQPPFLDTNDTELATTEPWVYPDGYARMNQPIVLSVSGHRGKDNFTSSYTITPEITPKTYDLYVKQSNQSQRQTFNTLAASISAIKTLDENTWYDCSVVITRTENGNSFNYSLYSTVSSGSPSRQMNLSPVEILQRDQNLVTILRQCADSDATSDASITATISLYSMTVSQDIDCPSYSNQCQLSLSLTQEQLNQLLALPGFITQE